LDGFFQSFHDMLPLNTKEFVTNQFLATFFFEKTQFLVESGNSLLIINSCVTLICGLFWQKKYFKSALIFHIGHFWKFLLQNFNLKFKPSLHNFDLAQKFQIANQAFKIFFLKATFFKLQNPKL